MHLSSKHYITTFIRAESEHRQILSDLVSKIRALLSTTYTDIIWNQPEAILIILSCIEKLLLNGLRAHKPDNTPDCWRFIEGLNWLNPQMTSSIANHLDRSSTIHIPFSRVRNDKTLVWIYESLESNTFSKKLRYLVSDREHLANCYEITAYLHSQRYVNALFICLNAIETEQPHMLSQIDQSLYEIKDDIRESYSNKGHKRSTSYPNFSYTTSCSTVPKQSDTHDMGAKIALPLECDDSPVHSRRSSLAGATYTPSQLTNATGNATTSKSSSGRKQRKHSNRIRFKGKSSLSQKLRPWMSLPDIRYITGSKWKPITRSKSVTIRSEKSKIRLTSDALAMNERYKTTSKSTQCNDNTIYSSSAPANTHARGTSDQLDLTPINLVKCDDIKIHLDHKHSQAVREEAALNACAAAAISVEPAISETTTKASSQFGDFLRNIPGKRNMFFSSVRPGGSSPTTEKQGNLSPSDFVNTFLPRVGEKIQNRYTNKALQDVAVDNETPLLISQPGLMSSSAERIQPTRGQSIASYLQALQMCRSNVTDLERENAHFDLSDAIISAIEQVKCINRERLQEKKLKAERRGNQPLWRRPRRLKNWVQPTSGNLEASGFSESDLSLSTTSSETSSGSDLSHVSNNSASSNNSTAGDLKYLQIFSVSSHSINDHAAYAEWSEPSFEAHSAEGIALSLISKFKDKQLPSASEILSDVPTFETAHNLQYMNERGLRSVTCTRGTADWAPPRAQIIFTRHPPPDRKRLLQLQHNKCAGCGMLVAPALSHYFRFCEYLGKYHCTGCHRNQISTIPARVLDRWDFSCHQVSVFAYRLLEQIWKIPLFRVPDLNKNLYGKVRALRFARTQRVQLKYISNFIKLCRFAEDAHKVIDKCPAYIIDDVDTWSMNDFVSVRNGSFSRDIHEIITTSERHVFDCELCTARGFLCEYCPQKQVIFPWQSKVIRCEKCGACAHSSCWNPDMDCSKCQRLKQRKDH